MKTFKAEDVIYNIKEDGVHYNEYNPAVTEQYRGTHCLEIKNTGDGYRIKGLLFDYSEAEMLLCYLIANRSGGPIEEIKSKRIL